MVAKVAGGIIGLGLIGTGGVAFVKPEWFGINRETWKPLSQDSDFANANSGYKGKFGETYKNYLTGVKGNQGWWKESFDKLKEDSLSQDSAKNPSEKFKHTNNTDSKVTKDFDSSENDDGAKALNQICKKVYKSASTNIDTTGTSNDNYKEADVWKYCSPLGSKPKTITEASETNDYGSGSIGNGSDSNSTLISIKGNDKFWEIRQQEFYGSGLFKNVTNKVTVEDSHNFFKEEKKKETHIKDICKLAYGNSSTTSASSTTAPTKDETKKYCSLTITN